MIIIFHPFRNAYNNSIVPIIKQPSVYIINIRVLNELDIFFFMLLYFSVCYIIIILINSCAFKYRQKCV